MLRPTSRDTRRLWWAVAWTLVFIAAHGYWYLGGRIGLGDAPRPLPDAPASAGAWAFTVVVAVMFALGLAAPLLLLRQVGNERLRRVLVVVLWAGALVLIARGASGLLDDAVRHVGLSSRGITGLSYAETLGTAHPSVDAIVSTTAVDAYFLLGGVLYGAAARRHSAPRRPTSASSGRDGG